MIMAAGVQSIPDRDGPADVAMGVVAADDDRRGVIVAWVPDDDTALNRTAPDVDVGEHDL